MASNSEPKRSFSADPTMGLISNPQPVCPSCGREYHDAWELDLDDGEESEIQCARCDATFFVVAHISTTYSTSETPWGRR
jgi:hypothetical protein